MQNLIDEYIAAGGFQAWQKLSDMCPQDVIDEDKIRTSRTWRCWFPAGEKWSQVARQKEKIATLYVR
ncbi:MAG: hypothetical protein ACLSF5_03310 [Blautia massiliensis (ex Durand et al. 2017)]|uniref:hypothetical protein n=1 Tax=Blautia massiliensis (ex Durand et al. 2017) TaxID=1737424 RepID=UPI003993445E